MKSKIMVVDDEMHIRELVRFYLDKAGFDTIEAGMLNGSGMAFIFPSFSVMRIVR